MEWFLLEAVIVFWFFPAIGIPLSVVKSTKNWTRTMLFICSIGLPFHCFYLGFIYLCTLLSRSHEILSPRWTIILSIVAIPYGLAVKWFAKNDLEMNGMRFEIRYSTLLHSGMQ
jgi:hypothetical protein